MSNETVPRRAAAVDFFSFQDACSRAVRAFQEISPCGQGALQTSNIIHIVHHTQDHRHWVLLASASFLVLPK